MKNIFDTFYDDWNKMSWSHEGELPPKTCFQFKLQFTCIKSKLLIIVHRPYEGIHSHCGSRLYKKLWSSRQGENVENSIIDWNEIVIR